MVKTRMVMDIGEGAFAIPAPRLLKLVPVVDIMSEWSMVMMIEMGQLEAVKMRHARNLAYRKGKSRGYSHNSPQRGC